MKRILVIISIFILTACSGEVKKENIKADSTKVKKDSVKVEQEPKGYKSAHQEHYEEFKKDSVSKR
ncbi:MAG: membrane lipoprotein lipid attachment site-containing protein [Melioribacteraceae bacterium]|nr:membrane lipoprotein lipid attachment site-containing protein [Melioribacteraceae bacterium]